MNIYTQGYAIGGVAPIAIAELMQRTSLQGSRPICLTAFIDGSPYTEWMGRDVEVKGFASGIYLDTEYTLEEAQLLQLSKESKGVLSLFYYQNMGSYGCSYYVGGKAILDRITIVDKDMKDIDGGREFTGHSTQQIIEKLFPLLTGETLGEAVAAKGKMYLIKNEI